MNKPGGLTVKYDFDTKIDRLNTASVKWDEVEHLFGQKDVLPMWIADMEFMSPNPVIEALKRRVEHGVYGYTTMPESYYQSIIDWEQKRHHFAVQKEWISYSPGVVPALAIIVQSFTEVSDKVLIQSPVYTPFFDIVKQNERVVVNSQLVLRDGRYSIDFDDLEEKLKSGVKLMILCNPHNPVGRVWTREELSQIGALCLKYHVLIVSDEIHADIVYPNHTHTPIASLSESFAQNSLTCIAPSKTFNIAGLKNSSVIIPNREHRLTFRRAVQRLGMGVNSAFGVVAHEAAYREGDAWLEELMDYLTHNRQYVIDFVRDELPDIQVIEPDGTYLAWLDCRNLHMEPKELEQFMRTEAKVGCSQGYMFGPGGEGFERLNIACPKAMLSEALHRIKRAVDARKR